MDRKFFNGLIAGALTTLIICAIGVGILTVSGRLSLGGNTNALTFGKPNELAEAESVLEACDSSGMVIPSKDFLQQSSEMMTYLSSNYYCEVDKGSLEESMLRGMTGELDKYTFYYNEDEYKDVLETDSGKYCGMGAVVTQNLKTMEIIVTRPYPDSPAYKAGMKRDDVIVAVDGTDVVGMELNNVVNMIRGEAGKEVVVTVTREGSDKPIDLHIVRAEIEVRYVEHHMIENDIGYIYVSGFEMTTAPQFEAAYRELLEKGMKSLIIDLRDNPGGYVNTCTDMLDLFVEKDKKLLYYEGKEGVIEEIYSATEEASELPIAIIINNNSASASEIFSGCLHDYGKATLVGDTSFGKGIAQNFIPIGNGKAAFQYTFAHYYLPNGECIHEEGIKPDVEVALDEEYAKTLIEDRESDNQIDAAVEYLKEKMK